MFLSHNSSDKKDETVLWKVIDSNSYKIFFCRSIRCHERACVYIKNVFKSYHT